MAARLVHFLLALMLACLTAAVATWGLGVVWRAIGGRDMTVHGWIALGLGLLGTVGLAWGLMALAFRSSREGWDDAVDNSLDPGPRSHRDDDARDD